MIDTLQKFVCNSRPRRFGKTVTAEMLSAYYSRGCDSEKLFEGLEISKSDSFQKHLNRYDVLHFDVQWCMEPAGGPEQVVSYISREIIAELRREYPDVLAQETTSLPEALSQINAATGKKFIVIIDEWDVLIRDEAANSKVQEEYINFLRGMFKGTEPTRFIHLAYLTGILPIKRFKTESALNNFTEYTMLSAGELAPYIGFTEEEVQALCEKRGYDFPEVKRWYDGYRLENYHVYNPSAVVNLMLRGSFQSYWSKTGTYESIVPLINMNFGGLRASVIEMLSGNSVEVEVGSFQNDMVSFKNQDDVMTLLIHLGYLAYDSQKCRAYIPNEEIQQEFLMATRRNQWNELIQFQMESENLLDATLNQEEGTVAQEIEKIHDEYASNIQYHNENSLSSVLTIAYLSTMEYYFKPIRELPTGRGFADFVYLPKPEYRADYPALLVELKWNQQANTALKQIKEKKYPEVLMQYTGNILLIGITYDRKTKRHFCTIEKMEK